MKRTLKYPELWQKKRNELPVNGSPDAGWQQMRSLLDKQMPAPALPKKPFRFKMPKWGLHIFIGVSSVVAVYVGYQVYLSKNHLNPAKPGNQQIHHDSLAPAVKDTLPVRDAVKSADGGIAPGDSPAAAPGFINQTKLSTDATQKGRRETIDSIAAPPMLNLPVHRDSAIVPMEVVPLKAIRDSASAVDLGKKDIRKDTSKIKTTPKKKKRKLSVFF